MEIVIEGWRAGDAERKKAREVPAEALPRLTHEQKEVARKLKIREEDYARSVAAGRESQNELLAKARSLGVLLETKLRARNAAAVVRAVRLKTIDHRFEIEATLDGRELFLRIEEDLVDDLLESGSREMEQRIDRIVDYAVASRVA